MRILIALIGATTVTLGLFYFMAFLISGEHKLSNKYASESFIEFVRLKPQSVTETRQRKLPKKPEPPKPKPPMQAAPVSQNQQNVAQDLNMDMPNMDLPLNLGGGPYLGAIGGGGAANADRELLPLVRIEPRYPRRAAMSGTEGWVLLEFDITETGTVSNVRVAESKPPRIFNQAAKRALLKWKYKPKVESGKPIAQLGNRVRIDFKLQQ